MFEVRVADNFHYMDESEVYAHGKFLTWAEAVAAARRIVDEFLLSEGKPTMTAEELYKRYTMFGEDPYIAPTPDGEETFSAWDYAKQRCAELCR